MCFSCFLIYLCYTYVYIHLIWYIGLIFQNPWYPKTGFLVCPVEKFWRIFENYTFLHLYIYNSGAVKIFHVICSLPVLRFIGWYWYQNDGIDMARVLGRLKFGFCALSRIYQAFCASWKWRFEESVEGKILCEKKVGKWQHYLRETSSKPIMHVLQ